MGGGEGTGRGPRKWEKRIGREREGRDTFCLLCFPAMPKAL